LKKASSTRLRILGLSNKSYKVQNKKQRDTAAQDAEMQAKRLAEGKQESNKENLESNPDILGEQDDADVIF
jgi:V-type H+-transporting ATPase subunit D